MKFFEPPRTLAMGGDGNGLYPHGDEKGRSWKYTASHVTCDDDGAAKRR